jgi:hypothetical protein
MTLEAPLSKYKRNNFLIGIAVCVGLALWCGYDGYFSKTFKQEHAQWWGVNRVAPFVLLPAAAVLGAWLYAIRRKKVAAEENELVVAGKERIPYDAIDRIDKTYFEKKGFFTLVYKKEDGREVHRKLSDRDYDNLKTILDHLIAKIT